MRAAKTNSRPQALRTNAKSHSKRKFLVAVSALAVSALAAYYLIAPPSSRAISTTILISEVESTPTAGGSEWFELTNVSNAAITLTGWTITDNTSSDTIPTFTLNPGEYAVIAESSTNFTAVHPTYSGTLINLGSAIGNGLADTGDVLTLKDNGSVTIDCMSYGTNTTCLNAAVTPVTPAGSNLTYQRYSNLDTDTRNDWAVAAETPGAALLPNAVMYDNTGSGGDFDATLDTGFVSGKTVTWSHTVGSGNNRALIVGVSTAVITAPGPAVDRVTSVTYGGTPLTRLGSQRDSTVNSGIEMFILVNPPAGTANVVATIISGVNYVVGGSASFFGVHQTTPTGTFTSATGNDTTPTVAVTTTTGDVVIDTVGTLPSGFLTPGAGQTGRWNGRAFFSSAFDVGAGSTEPGVTPSTTMSWTSNSQPWSIGAVALKPAAVTLIELASFTASRTKAGALLQWQTGYEVDNLGFNLYREVKGRRVRITPSIVAGSALLAGQNVALTAGRSYRWLDRQSSEDAQYWLEDIDINGKHTFHGPIVPASGDNSRTLIEQDQSPLLDELNEMTASGTNTSQAQYEHPARMSGPRTAKESDNVLEGRVSNEINSALGETSLDRQLAIAARSDAIKLLVNHNGWYRVSQAELVAAGLNPDADPRLLQLYADGEEVPILVNSSSGAKFGPTDSIEFYGAGLNTPWTDTQVYWLIVGQTPGARIRKTKVRSLGQPTISQPNLPGRPDKPEQPVNSPGAARPVSTAGTSGAQQGQTLFNWLPMPPLPTLTPERRSPKPGPTTATPPVLLDKPVDATVLPDVAPASPSITAKPSSTPAAQPAATATMLAEPQPITATSPTTNAQSATSSQPATKKSLRRKRRKNKVGVKKNSKDASRRRLRSHAATNRTGADGPAESFSYTIENAERTLHFAALKNGEADNFFGQMIAQDPASIKLNIRHLASATGQSTLEVALQGVTDEGHQVKVNLNGTDVGRINFTGREHPAEQFSISNALLRNGENVLTLSALQGETDISLVDRVKLTYPHTYEADSNSLWFSVEGRQTVIVDGFNSPSVRMIDISNPNQVEELVVASEPQGPGYALAFETKSDGTLLAMTDSQVEHPAQVVRNQPSSWYNYKQGADLLIITHQNFVNALAPLIALRQSQGLVVTVVDVDDIYDEFGYGAHVTPALRTFLNWTTSHWQLPPRYVLLVGDCSFDPHNYLGQGQFDFVPTRFLDTEYMETASDDSLADFNNDGIPEMAVGRLPVRTASDASTVVGKIVAFQNGNLSRGALLVSDHKEGFDFEAANNRIRALLPSTMAVQSVNRGSNDATAVRGQVINGINQGPLIVNYLGHGSLEMWTGAGILRSSDVPQLSNNQSLSFFVMMTCLNGFAQGTSDSLSEALLKSGSGGAAAVWASSGLTEPYQQTVMNQQLFKSLFGDQPVTIGDAIISAKAATQNIDARRTWMLMGDPTTRLR
ncbi:MAG TPA: C25 family cysteine peptidase [Pyrinomonadaceae bacterium]|jgi:hypothetical protein